VITNWKLVKRAEDKRAAAQPVNYRKNLRIFEAMWHEAKDLKAFSSKTRQSGLEAPLRIARFLNP
jgi:hypothetical protein